MALKYCSDKGKTASSGKKLSQSVKSVVLSFKDVDSSLSALQSALGGNSSSSSSKTAPEASTPGPSSPSLPILDSPKAATNKEVDDARAIYSIYGVSPPPKKTSKVEHDVQDIVSSQEVLASQHEVVSQKKSVVSIGHSQDYETHELAVESTAAQQKVIMISLIATHDDLASCRGGLW